MRGRNNNNNNNNNNRKGPNPLTRNYESNGPDVKIRGSAQQIAEKYAALARDAQSAGDRVMAENYLQHAEHYNRIIAAAQAQMPIHQQARDNRDDVDDELEDELEGGTQQEIRAPENQPQQQQPQAQQVDGSGPQPVIEGMPAEVALNQENTEVNGSHEPRANGNHVASAGGEEEAPARRPRRPRRPRSRPESAEQANAGEAAEPNGNATTPEATAHEDPDPAAVAQG
jgi:hypothetical protein